MTASSEASVPPNTDLMLYATSFSPGRCRLRLDDSEALHLARIDTDMVREAEGMYLFLVAPIAVQQGDATARDGKQS